MKTPTILANWLEVDGVSRWVELREIEKGHFEGHVGSCFFKWNRHMFKLPYVNPLPENLPGDKECRKTRRRVAIRKFIEAVIEELNNGHKSPVHVEPDERGGGKADGRNLAEVYISGVPKWMQEMCKEWVACYSRQDGSFLYYRRARFKTESLETVKAWLSFCSRCIHRTLCEGPCENPASNSKEAIL